MVATQMHSPAGLEHWPNDFWSDYPFAYVRLTTLRVARETHLLFGCVEMLPGEIHPLPAYNLPRLKVAHNATVMSSLTVLSSEAALRWYENSPTGVITIPGAEGQPAAKAVQVAPEPRLGDLIVARTLTVSANWQSCIRMHRMVPMDSLPQTVKSLLAPGVGNSNLRKWLIHNCFIDLAAFPDCAGGLVLLAPNPIVRSVSYYPTTKATDGREVLSVRLVPRKDYSLETISVLFSEIRPDGYMSTLDVALDPLGKGRVALSQDAFESTLEIRCARRGLLSAPPHTAFLRSIRHQLIPVRASMSIEVPARRKGAGKSSYQMPIGHVGPIAGGAVGTPADDASASRLAFLLGTRTATVGAPIEEVIFRSDRQFAVDFIRGLVSHAMSHVLFVDRFFSFDDIRDFALAVLLGSCQITVLTSKSPDWHKPLGHLESEKPQGELMVRDVEEINRLRVRNGLLAVDVRIMNSEDIHDRFLIIDERIWLFGSSFRSLGQGSLSVASVIRDASILLPTLINAAETAETFASFWEHAQSRGDRV